MRTEEGPTLFNNEQQISFFIYIFIKKKNFWAGLFLSLYILVFQKGNDHFYFPVVLDLQSYSRGLKGGVGDWGRLAG